jgi:hypothetical protein
MVKIPKLYKQYVAKHLTKEGPTVTVTDKFLCDVCGGKSKKWMYAIPDLCEEHARELGLIW